MMAYRNISSGESGLGPSPAVPEGTMVGSILNPVPIKLIVEESCFLLSCIPPLTLLFLLYLIVSYITYLAGGGEHCQRKFRDVKRVLLVTAHPDDECMFFGPTLTQLTSTAVEVYLVCLSDGGYDGIGVVRTNELWLSCDRLNISQSNIRIFKHPHLRDNPKSSWSPLLIGHIISQFVETFSIDTLITFDAYGVSGHLNHCAIYRAIMHLSGKRGIPNYCKIYVLESVGIFRKYSVCTDLIFSYFMSKYVYVSSLARRQMILEAMAQHSSQLLWYRRLFLIFSRYSYINTLRSVS